MISPEQLRREYTARINRTFDYIEKNIAQQFRLDELAQVANFSKFHFARIFQAHTGEPPFQFIQRIRLERAASMLLTKPNDSLTEVAFNCGFSDLSVFSRNFKKHFGQSPSAYRNSEHAHSNMSQMHSKSEQAGTGSHMYFCNRSQTIKWNTNMEQNKSVEVQELPSMTVAYVRHVGPYKGDASLFEGLWNKLFTWAGPRGLVGGPDFRSLAMYHDDPNITEEAKLRTSVCISVPANTKVDGEIGKMKLDGGKHMVARFEVTAEQFEEAWKWVYAEWLPSSGYQPDDKPCFEMYPEEPRNGIFIVDICVPVRPL